MATHMRRSWSTTPGHATPRGARKVVRVVWEDARRSTRPPDDPSPSTRPLTRLAQVDARASRVVELKCFGGLTENETADVIGISLATVKRDWTFAKAWLFRALTA
jgi:DNA-directed RNA polymerase specialized sigma24 family protein